jgi:hypothetical protein
VFSIRGIIQSIRGRQARRIGDLISNDTRLVAIPLDIGLQCRMIELNSDAMEMMPMGTHEKISRFIVGDKIWETIEKTAQELGSWMAEQGKVPLLIRYEGSRITTMGVMRQVRNRGEEVMWVPRRETSRDQEEDGNQRKEENQEAGHPRRRHRVRLDGIKGGGWGQEQWKG